MQELFLAAAPQRLFRAEDHDVGAISPSTGRTLPDRYVEGTCPICGYDAARGDQCDNCGNQLDPIDLINPRSRINGETPVFVESEHFFLDLPALRRRARRVAATSTDWRPNVLKFSMNLLDDLRPRAMTRDIDWGIPVPLDGWRDRPDKKLYVWFDAVIGYLSASIEWARRYGRRRRVEGVVAATPTPSTYYFMGKDNITFHSQIWPALLLGHDGAGRPGRRARRARRRSNLPTEVVSSEFLTMSGSKFSTSRETVIYVGDFLREYGPDALRYFISAAGPENQDADFTWDEFVRRTNFELANEWGNLVNRSISMAHKNFGAIPQPTTPAPTDAELLAALARGFDTVGDAAGAQPVQGRPSARRCGSSRPANKYLSDTSRGSSATTRHGRPPCCTPRCRSSTTPRRC